MFPLVHYLRLSLYSVRTNASKVLVVVYDFVKECAEAPYFLLVYFVSSLKEKFDIPPM